MLQEAYMDTPQMLRKSKLMHEAALRLIEECYLKGEGGKVLNLASLGLKNIPKEIVKLRHLTKLFLNDNELTSLPEEIAQFDKLRTLTLSSNSFSEIPKVVFQLTSLKKLFARGNQITSVPSQIGQMSGLNELHLDHNNLSTLPNEIVLLPELQLIDVTGNELEYLPPDLHKMPALVSIYLHENPALKLPFEVLGPVAGEYPGNWKSNANARNILDYYYRVHPSGRHGLGKPIQEARIIVLGDGAAGKTSIVRRLLRNEPARETEPSTRDVVIDRWTIVTPKGKVQVNVWDFGGQKQMHAAHPYFFTTRTLYLVVAEARKDQQQRIEYWLKMVAKYGGEARALVAVNKVEPEGHPMELDRPKLLGRHSQNLPCDSSGAFFPTSCTVGAGIGQLRTAIINEVTAMDQVWALWPREWFKVKQFLYNVRNVQEKPRIGWIARLKARLPSHHNTKGAFGLETLTYGEWRTICDQCGVSEETDRDLLLERLGHLGLVVAFPRDIKLRGLGVLNPEWVTRGLYPLLIDARIADNNGMVKIEDIADILPQNRFPKEQHQWLIDLLVAFELLFHDTQNNLLLSNQLPVDSPVWAQYTEWVSDDKENGNPLHLELRYDTVLPESVISQFIVRRHRYARKNGEWWRHGIALKLNNSEALVRAHTSEHEAKIELRIKGPREDRHAMLKMIQETLRDARDLIPPILYVVLGEGCAVPYEDLKTHAGTGIREIPFIIGGKSVIRKLADILDTITAYGPHSAQVQKAHLVFKI